MMVFETEKKSLRRIALMVGITMLIMAAFAMVAVGAADSGLNIYNESFYQFQAGIFSWLIVLICDILIAWGFYILLKQIDKNLSLLGAWLRLIYAAILGTAILNLIHVSILLSGVPQLQSIQADQLKSLALLNIMAFHKMWSFGLIIFGVHLFIIGCLVMKSGYIPKILGILLIIAAFSYMLIHLMHLILPQYESITHMLERILSLPMALGELGLGIWMLAKGGKTPVNAN